MPSIKIDNVVIAEISKEEATQILKIVAETCGHLVCPPVVSPVSREVFDGPVFARGAWKETEIRDSADLQISIRLTRTKMTISNPQTVNRNID